MAMRGPDYEPPLVPMLNAGVAVIAGTDAGVGFVPHHGYVGGLIAMGDVGMPADDVLHAATARAAVALGVDHLTGRIAPGMEADLIAVEGDPRTNLPALRELRLVLARGTRFVPDDLPPLELDAEQRAMRQALLTAAFEPPRLLARPNDIR
jgi:imidazolonepropionase-like amidohydrolase